MYIHKIKNKSSTGWTGAMVQWVEGLAAELDDLRLISGTHMVEGETCPLTATDMSCLRTPHTLIPFYF